MLRNTAILSRSGVHRDKWFYSSHLTSVAETGEGSDAQGVCVLAWGGGGGGHGVGVMRCDMVYCTLVDGAAHLTGALSSQHSPPTIIFKPIPSGPANCTATVGWSSGDEDDAAKTTIDSARATMRRGIGAFQNFSFVNTQRG